MIADRKNEPDDESTLALTLLVELVSLAKELNIGSKKVEGDSALWGVHDDGSDLRLGG